MRRKSKPKEKNVELLKQFLKDDHNEQLGSDILHELVGSRRKQS